jgi:ribosomal protein L12E/L44/L45/RPP1/RPP2
MRYEMATKLTVLVPDELHRQARAVAALKGDNISNIVREALAEYVTQALRPTDDSAAVSQAEGSEAADVDQEFARQVAEFIERYRPALQALAR